MSEASPHTAETRPAPDLSIVVPVYNEADNIAPLIGEISAALAGALSHEIVYVDDGSTDDTPARLRGIQAQLRDAGTPTLRFFRHARCYGQSAAIATGVARARAPVIATLDGDGQNDPADIAALLAAWKADADPDRLMVAGLRAKRRDSAIKRLSSRVANGVRARLLGDNTADTGCGLKVFARAAFLGFPQFDHMHRFLPALMIRGGGRVQSVPVNHRPRERGRSKYGTLDRLWVGVFDLIGVMWLQRRGSMPEIEPDEEPRR